MEAGAAAAEALYIVLQVEEATEAAEENFKCEETHSGCLKRRHPVVIIGGSYDKTGI